MKKFAKWIGGGLGWALLGPLGGIIGFLVGSMIDQGPDQLQQYNQRTTTPGDFMMSLLVLVAAMMKA
ncbi:MAG: molecular chaperone DnaJ, partial [Bacteroidota bacterium]